MHIIRLNDTALANGKDCFRSYMAAKLCGPRSDAHAESSWRRTGPHMLVGVLLACVEHGVTAEDDLVAAAARITRCRKTTARDVLSTLTGKNPKQHLFGRANGAYHALRKVEAPGDDWPEVLLAA